ncbi:hypothetical protein [Brevibacillus brevis]|uniref:Uncharacterized protein n=1 Tax=Brevibacillus brevis TaxID=1393 RepID=A0ABY9SY35_BREBE|nr:hypothetical protein [Brevibacillus brevis]WNC12742.1 hypothetical protein RGB73_18645 [Brevibacillus brevis]
MNERLLQPSLRKGGVKETKSYQISSFVYAGFFGGVLPVLALGTVNCLWLRAKRSHTAGLFLTGMLLIASTFFYTWIVGNWLDALLCSRVLAVGLAIAYRCTLKRRFRLHSVVNGRFQPLAKPAILLSAAGVSLELLEIHAGEVFHDGLLVG